MSHEILVVAAFTAGVVVFFSPCATALLPAYLSYYLSRGDRDASEPVDSPRTVKAGLAGLGAGFGLLAFALVDAVLSFGDRMGTDMAFGLVGGLVMALGGFVTREGVRDLDPEARTALFGHLRRGFAFGAAASLGLMATYLALGLSVVLAVRLGIPGVEAALPLVAFGAAAILVALGALMVLGKDVRTFVPRLRAPSGRHLRGFFVFGAGYGLIASSCFLPVFLQVISAALTVTPPDAVQVLLAYAGGSAVVFVLISMAASVARGASLRALRAWRPYIHRVAGAVVIAMGAYVLWFDWTFLLSRGL